MKRPAMQRRLADLLGAPAVSDRAIDVLLGRPGTIRVNRFPLMELGLCRCRCEALVRRMGFPVPRKSACQFCPYGSRGDWQLFAETNPPHFDRTALLEENKPPTKAGHKLSIMDYRTHRDADGAIVRVQAPTVREFIAKPYKPRPKPCRVCDAAQRAAKVAGCNYLEAA